MFSPQPAPRTGLTTGTCAAAAAKAATMLLCRKPASKEVGVRIADGCRVRLSVIRARTDGKLGEAAVRKDAGGDPDITHRALIVAAVRWRRGRSIVFKAGPGVGTVTKPGLAIPPGEPAINPVPRKMIETAVREVTRRGVEVTVSIPGGRKLAARTFNPRLGVVGGLSILGTTGRVRPFSTPALRDALRCAVNVAKACGVTAPVLVPGHIGERAARRHFRLKDEQVIEVGNEWGFVLGQLPGRPFARLLVVGHPGKLAKLAAGDWDTHSSRSGSAVPPVRRMAGTVLGKPVCPADTVEGLLEALTPGERRVVGNRIAERVQVALARRVRKRIPIAVVLINLKGNRLGSAGDLTPWRQPSISIRRDPPPFPRGQRPRLQSDRQPYRAAETPGSQPDCCR